MLKKYKFSILKWLNLWIKLFELVDIMSWTNVVLKPDEEMEFCRIITLNLKSKKVYF